MTKSKLTTLIAILLITNSLAAQLKIEKDKLKIYKDEDRTMVLCAETQENVMISFTKTNKSVRLSIQRNDLSQSFQSSFEYSQEKNGLYMAFGNYYDKDFELVVHERDRQLFLVYGDNFAFSVQLTAYEHKKLIKYITGV